MSIRRGVTTQAANPARRFLDMADRDDHRGDRAVGPTDEWTTGDDGIPHMSGVQRSSTAARMDA